MVTADDVVGFLALPVDDDDVLARADQALTVVREFAKAYTRGNGFTGQLPTEDIAQVMLTAAARLVSNTRQLSVAENMGPFGTDFRGGFTGWTLVETFVLDRYRMNAL